MAQVSVDTAHHVITSIQAHHADKRDSQCLGEIMDDVLKNLKPQGVNVEEVIADTNYSSGEAISYLENNNLKGYIPNHGSFKLNREGFTYNKENDCYVCSHGMQLKYTRTYIENTGYTKIEYRSRTKDCKYCPLRKECIGKAPFKRITHNIDKPLYERMHLRMQTRYARRMMKVRQSTVEPVLGTLVNFLAMRRVNTRGIDLADKCMVMSAIVYNLKKLMKFCPLKVKVMAKAMGKLETKIEKRIFLILNAIRVLLNRNSEILFSI